MEFTIGQNASLPVLKMQVVKDGTQNFDDMMEFIERSSIFFSMVSTDTGIPKVYTKSAGFVEKLEMNENASPEYYVYYRFTSQDTSRIGRYEGQFMFINDDGTLVLPIREPLFINVVESFISDSLPYNPCYTLNYSCCTTPFPSPTPTPTKAPVISPTPAASTTPTPTVTPTPTQTPNQPICPHPVMKNLVYGTDQFGPFNNVGDLCYAELCFSQGNCTTSDYLVRFFNLPTLNVGALLFDNEISCNKTNDTGYFLTNYNGGYRMFYVTDGVITEIVDCN
jgi:hypothetical protein